MDTPQNPQQPPTRKMRWLGFFLFVSGLVVGYLAILVPLASAARHEQDITISPKAIALAPGLIMIGLTLFFMGNDGAGRLMGSRNKPTPMGLTICLMIVLIDILLYELVKSKLRQYGVTFDETPLGPL